MPPVDRRNPIRAASSESTCYLLEFIREFPDDEACLQHVWRERYAPDGEHATCPRLRGGEGFPSARDDEAEAGLVLPDLRLPHPPAEGDDLRAVVHVPAALVLRHVPDH